MGARKLLTLGLVAVALVVAARYLFENEKRVVRRRLDAMAAAASNLGAEAVTAGSSRATELGRFVTDDVIIRTDASTFVGGRPAVVKYVLDAAGARGHMAVSLGDFQIELIDASTAAAFFTLNVSRGNSGASESLPRQVHATLSKMGGQWLLSRGEVLRTLEPTK